MSMNAAEQRVFTIALKQVHIRSVSNIFQEVVVKEMFVPNYGIPHCKGEAVMSGWFWVLTIYSVGNAKALWQPLKHTNNFNICSGICPDIWNIKMTKPQSSLKSLKSRLTQSFWAFYLVKNFQTSSESG